VADSTASTKTAKAAISQRRKDRQDRGAADLRADFGERGEGAGAVLGEGVVEALVRSFQAEAAAADQHVDDEEGEQDRRRGQQQEAGEHREEEDEGGVARGERGGEAIGQAAGGRVEDREATAVVGPLPRRS
jgi:hypothetical protein